MNSQEAKDLFKDVFMFEPTLNTVKGYLELTALIDRLSAQNLENDLIHRALLGIAKAVNPNDEIGICVINTLVYDNTRKIFTSEEIDRLTEHYVLNLDLSKRCAIKDRLYFIDLLMTDLRNYPTVRAQMLAMIQKCSASDIIELGESPIKNSPYPLKQGYGQIISYLYQLGVFNVVPELAQDLLAQYIQIDNWHNYSGIDLVTAIGPLIKMGVVDSSLLEPLVESAIANNGRHKLSTLIFPGYIAFDSETFLKAYFWFKDRAVEEFEAGTIAQAVHDLASVDDLLASYGLTMLDPRILENDFDFPEL